MLNYARSASITFSPNAETGTSVFGTTSFYPFSVVTQKPQSFDGFSVEADRIGWHAFEAKADLFVIPSLISVPASTSTFVNVTVAARSDMGHNRRDPEEHFTGANVSAPVPQQGTLAPKVQSWTIPVSRSRSLGNYELSNGSLDLGILSTRAVMIDVVDGKVADKAVL